MRLRWRTCFTWPTSRRTQSRRNGPSLFFYNGGPGSSTVWLHMGSLGPKHVMTAGDTHLPGAPYTMVDNPYSLLDVSDLVFVDMPGTGFGRLVGKDGEKAFWGVDGDANAFARFIARFMTKYGRWNSPKFIFGESYGTTRSAVLANLLENKHDIDLNGVILLSQIFNFTTDIDQPGRQPRRGPALRIGVADVCRDGLVPQKAAATAACAGAVPERSGGVRDGTLFARSGAGNRRECGGKATGGGEAARLYRTACGLFAQGRLAREWRRVREVAAGRGGFDHGPPGYTFLRANARSAERKRRVRSAIVGDLGSVCCAVQRLRAARPEIRRGADLYARDRSASGIGSSSTTAIR